jgi:hypothetical protein
MGSNDCVAVAQIRSLTTVLDPTRTALMVANARSSATKATFAMVIETLVIVIDIVVVFVFWSKPTTLLRADSLRKLKTSARHPILHVLTSHFFL